MFKEHIELTRLDISVSNLSRTVKEKLSESAKEIYKEVGVEKTIVKLGNKSYLVHKIDYRTIRLIEVSVVEE